ncbi:serine hydrolase domain-containing protein [Mycolicibacterium goodii]|uniref:Beta-lactamase family protein n=1 Tax=Mycolicibacterium goodii TaxID=134601 RepID=A0ABS6HVH8_MYCGD|nr:serine hydrolase domain-containing protein [Mycolicibacterium goodii]MBU8816651.1 beta-lactamase family protein [Mycolicibacterium goodii]MBU8826316.1 beta-lactamase family protein [Mycolicibacterium goodii]MBU8828796.1 beta-lactamase family protein [Mycolicibacterium goodii]MBU8839689.1 beta-lactamase family protein [Mycolicibacterium goodii]ULN44947.1 beta-lactamase family protein [Mycolicibacterium goodii]
MRAARTLASLLLAALTLTAAPTVAAQPPELAVALDRVIEARLAQMGAPGAIVSLSIPDEIDYTKAFGVGDAATGVPMLVDDHHRIGSVTKTFTGTAILQLVEQGRIRLSDPVSRYVEGVPSGDEITLDMLGRMRSGLADYTETGDFIERLYRESPTGPDAFAVTPRELVESAFTQPLKFTPGSRYEYSNTNTVLLGMVVEKVSGIPLGQYLQDNIFGPLSLDHTFYPVNGWLPGPFGHGYNKAPNDAIVDTALWNPSWADAAGKVVSNVHDMRTWAQALGSGALLRPETQAERIGDGWSVVPGVDYSFGIFNVHGWRGHNGDIPGYATVAVYLPERGATLVVFVNSDVPEPHSAGQIAYAVTELVTPDNVYELGPQPPQLLEPSDG